MPSIIFGKVLMKCSASFLSLLVLVASYILVLLPFPLVLVGTVQNADAVGFKRSTPAGPLYARLPLLSTSAEDEESSDDRSDTSSAAGTGSDDEDTSSTSSSTEDDERGSTGSRGPGRGDPDQCLFCMETAEESLTPLLRFCMRCSAKTHQACWFKYRSQNFRGVSTRSAIDSVSKCPCCRGHLPGLNREKYAHLLPRDCDTHVLAMYAAGPPRSPGTFGGRTSEDLNKVARALLTGTCNPDRSKARMRPKRIQRGLEAAIAAGDDSLNRLEHVFGRYPFAPGTRGINRIRAWNTDAIENHAKNLLRGKSKRSREYRSLDRHIRIRNSKCCLRRGTLKCLAGWEQVRCNGLRCCGTKGCKGVKVPNPALLLNSLCYCKTGAEYLSRHRPHARMFGEPNQQFVECMMMCCLVGTVAGMPAAAAFSQTSVMAEMCAQGLACGCSPFVCFYSCNYCAQCCTKVGKIYDSECRTYWYQHHRKVDELLNLTDHSSWHTKDSQDIEQQENTRGCASSIGMTGVTQKDQSSSTCSLQNICCCCFSQNLSLQDDPTHQKPHLAQPPQQHEMHDRTRGGSSSSSSPSPAQIEDERLAEIEAGKRMLENAKIIGVTFLGSVLDDVLLAGLDYGFLEQELPEITREEVRRHLLDEGASPTSDSQDASGSTGSASSSSSSVAEDEATAIVPAMLESIGKEKSAQARWLRITEECGAWDGCEYFPCFVLSCFPICMEDCIDSCCYPPYTATPLTGD
ncbi:unnamed protein product [Amoebophrya sp. A25]|nr:unnamed protein product [Amoebophrya sp. A25]|eukprot:GSA25T00019039001.1